jgi:NADH-quinone oxidoreductase subunit C/D
MSREMLERVQQDLAGMVREAGSNHGDEFLRVAPQDVPGALAHLRDREDCSLLLDVVGVDRPDRPARFEVNYLLRSLPGDWRLVIKADLEEGESIPTVSHLFPAADWHEREVYDLFGIPFRGHPDLRRILCHHEFEGHALRKDYPIGRGQTCTTTEKLFDDHAIQEAASRASSALALAEGEEIHPSDLLTVNLGPSHPAMHGCLRAEVLLDGETIVDARAEIGYLHRCFEKEAEDHTWAQVMPYTDRLNYCSAMLNNVIYAHAVEKLLGVEITPRCAAIRVVMGELTRIIDHLVCVCTNLVDLGALTNYWYLYNVREGIYYEIIEKLCGSRLTTNYARIGGLSHDVFPGFADAVEHHLRKMEEGLADVTGLVARNRIFLDRTVGVGAISAGEALARGFTGPCLRAAGVAYDVRKHAPYFGYEQYEFDVPTGENGDTHDRIAVRMEEMRQSARIIRQALARLPDGPVDVDDPAVILPPKRDVYGSIEGVMNQFKLIFEGIEVPPGEAYGFGEGANGELGFYCVADGSGRPYRIKVRPPCFPIFAAYARLIRGRMIPDAIAVLGSLNIIAGELDR